AEEAILPVAGGVEELRSGNRGDIGQEVKTVLDIERGVFRAIDRGRQQRTLLAADILELLVVDAAVQDVDAGDQTVAEATNEAVVGDLGEAAIVLVAVIEPLENRMHQMAVDAEGAEFDLGVFE